MKHLITLFSFAIFAISVIGISGCREKEASSADEKQPTSRMQDPKYVAKINELENEQKQLMERIAKMSREYDEAKAEDPSGQSARFRAAVESRKKAEQELLAFRAKARAVVAARMHKEFKQNEKAHNKGDSK